MRTWDQRQKHAKLLQFGIAVSVAVAAFITVPAPASAAVNDLVVVNGGARTLTVCKSASSSTACAGATGTLSAGQNSKTKYGWADTDMIQLPKGCTLSQYTWYQSSMMWMPYATANSTRWVKTPGSNGNAVKFRVTC